MEGYSPNKKEKKKKYNSKKEALGMAAFGAAVAAVSYNPEANQDDNNVTDTSQSADSEYETNFEGHNSGINYDKETNTVTVKKESYQVEQENTPVKEMSLKEKLKKDIEDNNPKRFFKYDKYEGYSNEAKEFASWITETYNKLSRDENFAPADVFTDEYYMAIALTESGGDGQAESNAGAVGAMQLKPVAVRDLSRVLGVLKRRGADIDYFNSSQVLDGNELAREVLEMSKHDYPLNISMGKTYLNGVYATYPEFSGDRDLLTTAYNFGAPRVKKVTEGELDYNEEATGYAPKVNLYEKNIFTVKNHSPSLTNREVQDIVRDYGHHRGDITKDFIVSRVEGNEQIASL